MNISKIFNEKGTIKIQEANNSSIFINEINKVINIKEEYLNGQEHLITTFKSTQQYLIAIIKNSFFTYYLHNKDGNIFLTPYLNGFSKMSIDLKIKNYSNRFSLTKSKFSYIIYDNNTNKQIELNDIIFHRGVKPIFMESNYVENEPYIYMKISYPSIDTFLEYTIKSNKFSLKTAEYSIINRDSPISISLQSNNILVLESNNGTQKIKLNQIIKNKKLKLDLVFNIDEPILLKINNKIYLINKEGSYSYIRYNTRKELLFNSSTYSAKSRKNNLIIEGKIKYKIKAPVNTLVLGNGLILGEIIWENDTNFSVIIDEQKLNSIDKIHNKLYLAYGNKIIHTLVDTEDNFDSKVITYHNLNDLVYVVRKNVNNNFFLTMIPTSPVYTNKHQRLIKYTKILSSLLKPFYFHKNINLYFEKEASRALESSIYVFESVKHNDQIKSKNLFILDKSSSQYPKLKEKWGKNILDRFSFRHYLYIFLSDNFISSELSSHVISGRIYVDSISKKIKETPLYFLQHGIMFAKPVDNPMAKGFYKENQVNNIKKNVISSDLEAKEFHKMGYSNDDLIKTGLPKLDGAKLNHDANKITYMPTWRFWEEGYIITDEIERTTYFESIVNIIKLFEKEGLLDFLQITSHNKFSEYISNHLPNYQHILCPDPTEALLNSKIMITDYSSIIYDSIYRGTYPIFYWKESEYLIEKYQAIPPVNAENAPGKIAYDDESLIKYVKEAIDTAYHIPIEIIEKYRKINEFNDNNNTQRVIKELVKDNVL